MAKDDDILQYLEKRLEEAGERKDVARTAFEAAPRGRQRKVLYEQMLMAEAAWEELKSVVDGSRRVRLRGL